MPYQLIIFDFDGTLADSLTPAVAAYNRIAAQLHLKPIDDIEAARSMPTRQLLKQLGIRFWRLSKVVRAYRMAVADEAHEVRLHPGIVEAITHLAASGYRLGVLSSNSEENIRTCLRANGVEEHFAFVVGYPKLFGKAKALRKILRTERLDRSGVLFIGDELRDIEAGRKAKVATAAVTWGFHAEKMLIPSSATYLLRQPTDLLAVIVSADSRYGSLAILLGEALRVPENPYVERILAMRERVNRMDRTVLPDVVAMFAPTGEWDEAMGRAGVSLANEIMRRLGELRIE